MRHRGIDPRRRERGGRIVADRPVGHILPGSGQEAGLGQPPHLATSRRPHTRGDHPPCRQPLAASSPRPMPPMPSAPAPRALFLHPVPRCWRPACWPWWSSARSGDDLRRTARRCSGGIARRTGLPVRRGRCCSALGRRGALRSADADRHAASTSLAAALLAMHAHARRGTGIALMLLFNVGAAALLLPPRYGPRRRRARGASALFGEYAVERAGRAPFARAPLAEPMMFAISYVAVGHADQHARPPDARTAYDAGRTPRRARPPTWPRSTS